MLAIEQGQSGGLRGFLTKTIRGGWYTVDADDYLQRGHNDCGLRGKLDEYLRSQDVDPDDYPHAYLVTAPRFLGYQFNPVSFWYLYTSDKILSAMILEVNNTFDERRPYLVRSRLSTGPELLAGPTSDVSSSSRIKGLWLKDFHVSPFNSRKGTYSVLANDPLGPGMTGFQGVDVTINLSSSKGHPKLVARLFSQEQAIDPDSMSILAKIGFLSRWSWVGFATFPRIVKEAAALFFKRKLHVWYRPEPLRESLGRRATNTERDLEVAFRSYLRFLVGKCQKALSVAYVSSGIVSEVEETISSPSCGIQPGDIQKLGLKVLTPIFYSRFMHYAHDFEAIFTEFADSGTIWVDKPHLLTELFLKKGSPLIHTISTTDYFCFKSIQYLRRRPEQIPRVSTSADLPVSAPATVDIRDFRISPMDAYILEYADARLKKSYRSNLLRLFIADRYLMGYLGLLDGLLLVFQFGVARFLVTTLS
ncbi:hypothetical protein QQS21_005937 [Conoideocrella luteorostrata]|uniref:Uncharacterized protein n=1 Tax=Conoideocrella luteorostrata TaxID=1105319 RepID=A0AAJ0CNI7_9HYPO|nr:hypothetical protein QQS21_005937 [Conoideocrella luteorostrata]